MTIEKSKCVEKAPEPDRERRPSREGIVDDCVAMPWEPVKYSSLHHPPQESRGILGMVNFATWDFQPELEAREEQCYSQWPTCFQKRI